MLKLIFLDMTRKIPFHSGGPVQNNSAHKT